MISVPEGLSEERDEEHGMSQLLSLGTTVVLCSSCPLVALLVGQLSGIPGSFHLLDFLLNDACSGLERGVARYERVLP